VTTLPPQKPNDPRGWLTFDAPLPDDLQRAEDSTQHHDFYGPHVDWRTDYDPASGTWVTYFGRPATGTERELLTALGYELPEELTTRVSFPSPLTRRRRWPQLETDGSTP
jgi:hypothetical protein